MSLLFQNESFNTLCKHLYVGIFKLGSKDTLEVKKNKTKQKKL